MNNEETKTITIAGSIYFDPKGFTDKFNFISVLPERKEFWEQYSHTYIFIAPFTIEIEMPANFDPNKELLKSLQSQRKLILSENQRKLNEVDRQIQELQSIEHKP
jgi:hypothetical protein